MTKIEGEGMEDEKVKERIEELDELQKKLRGRIPRNGAQAKAVRRVKHLLRKKL